MTAGNALGIFGQYGFADFRIWTGQSLTEVKDGQSFAPSEFGGGFQNWTGQAPIVNKGSESLDSELSGSPSN